MQADFKTRSYTPVIQQCRYEMLRRVAMYSVPLVTTFTKLHCSTCKLSLIASLPTTTVQNMHYLPNVTIQRASEDDALRLSIFAGETFAQTFGHLYPVEDTANFLKTDYSEAVYLKYIKDVKFGVWIATFAPDAGTSISTESSIAGYVMCGSSSLPRTENLSGEVKKLYVDKAYFGKGLANVLFETGVAWLRKEYSGHPIYISVYSENFRAIKFYNRYKFEFHDEYLYVVGANRDREFILREVDSTAGLPYVREIVK